jgi:hypothetical protein
MVAVALATSGCGGINPFSDAKPCLVTPNPGLDVGAIDSSSGKSVCDFVAVATSVNLRDQLYDAGGCRRRGAVGQEGTYSVRVEAAGYLPSTVDGVVVPKNGDECTVVDTVRLDVRLTPAQ